MQSKKKPEKQTANTRKYTRKFEGKNSKISKNLNGEINQVKEEDNFESQVEFSQFTSQDQMPSDHKIKLNTDNSKKLYSSMLGFPQGKNKEIKNPLEPNVNTNNFSEISKLDPKFTENSIPHQIPLSELNLPQNDFEGFSNKLNIEQIGQNETENITQELIDKCEIQKKRDQELLEILKSLVDDIHYEYPHLSKEKIYKTIAEVGNDIGAIFSALGV